MSTMLRRVLLLASVLLALLPGTALAKGGNYGFEGGTPRQQTQVRSALEASSFDWSLVPRHVTVHIGAYGVSRSTPGHVWLDARLLDSGVFSWATVMDEYAHQVDYALLDARSRATLLERLGGEAWCYEVAGTAHAENGCERFASMVAWAYWPSADNAYGGSREASAMPAAEFRALLAELIGAPRALASARKAPTRKLASAKPRR